MYWEVGVMTWVGAGSLPWAVAMVVLGLGAVVGMAVYWVVGRARPEDLPEVGAAALSGDIRAGLPCGADGKDLAVPNPNPEECCQDVVRWREIRGADAEV